MQHLPIWNHISSFRHMAPSSHNMARLPDTYTCCISQDGAITQRTKWDCNHTSTNDRDLFFPLSKIANPKQYKGKKRKKEKKRKPKLHWAASMKYNYRNMNSFVKVVCPFQRSWWWEQPVGAQTACANANIITVSKNRFASVGQMIQAILSDAK